MQMRAFVASLWAQGGGERALTELLRIALGLGVLDHCLLESLRALMYIASLMPLLTQLLSNVKMEHLPFNNDEILKSSCSISCVVSTVKYN